ncbi:hypothetical protein GCM10010994_06660 [Chelatococcus reniformis]|uniref:Uncharacterized protein n=1 Tax=Chelatococcus reniformis TaxID=1494448 RepID=A0A916TXY8_9HYPH|nr:hypothetical protein GCM10010994_06660 [Chelatococcus reniformis]
MKTMNIAVKLLMPNTTMAIGIQAIGAIGAIRRRMGEISIVTVRDIPMQTPVTTAATNEIAIPHMTRNRLDMTACQIGTAWEPSPTLNELSASELRNTDGGGATAAIAVPCCRPMYSQAARTVHTDKVPSTTARIRSPPRRVVAETRRGSSLT